MEKVDEAEPTSTTSAVRGMSSIVSFRSVVMMWSMVPFGHDRIDLIFYSRGKEEGEGGGERRGGGEIRWRKRRWCCDLFGRRRSERTKISENRDILDEGHPRAMCLFRDVRNVYVEQYQTCPRSLCRPLFEPIANVGVAFLAGFLLHVVVASYYTVTESLGSSDTHRELGLWWGLLGLAWYVWATFFARQPRIVLETVEGETRVLALSDRATATRVAKAIASGSASPHLNAVPALSRSSPTAQAFPFVSILFILIANAAIVFGVLVKKCSDCGGCSDDGPPRDGCYYENDPEVPLGILVLLSCVSFIGWWVWMRYLRTVDACVSLSSMRAVTRNGASTELISSSESPDVAVHNGPGTRDKRPA